MSLHALVPWLESPGFGGAAAVAAASLAYVSARLGARTQRHNARSDRWWDRTKWAVELALSDDDRANDTGFAALAALLEFASKSGLDRDEVKFLNQTVYGLWADGVDRSVEANGGEGGNDGRR